MQYCTNCKRLTEEPVCPYCRSTKLRVALDADFCMFAELFYPQAEMLKELLDEQGIPCTEKSVRGAAVTVYGGANLDLIRLYVPYARFDEAEALYDAYFGGEATLVEENEEPEA